MRELWQQDVYFCSRQRIFVFFFIYLLCRVTFLCAMVFRETVTDVTRTRKCEYDVIGAENIKTSSQKSSNQGTRTPPTPVPMSTLHPTRIPVPVTLHMTVCAGVHESGLDTSQILSKSK